MKFLLQLQQTTKLGWCMYIFAALVKGSTESLPSPCTQDGMGEERQQQLQNESTVEKHHCVEYGTDVDTYKHNAEN